MGRKRVSLQIVKYELNKRLSRYVAIIHQCVVRCWDEIIGVVQLTLEPPSKPGKIAE